MSAWTKQQLEDQMFEIVDILQLSDGMIEEHGPLGTPVPELVKLVMNRKDEEIRLLRQGLKAVAA